MNFTGFVARALTLAVIASLASPGVAVAAGTLTGVGTATRTSLTHPSSNTTKEKGNFRKYTAGGNNIYVNLTDRYDNPYTGGWMTISSTCEDRAFRVDPCS